MNLKQKAMQSAVLAIGVVGMCGIAAAGTGVTIENNSALRQRTVTTETEFATGRTAGVVFAMDDLEEKSVAAFQQIGIEQIQADAVMAFETVPEVASADVILDAETEELSEDAEDTEIDTNEELAEEEPVLSEEEQLWQNRLMADVEEQMNVRAEASAESELVGRLRKGDAAEIIEKGEEWTYIRSGNVEGYVKNEYCVFGQEALEYAKEHIDTRAVVTANGLRVRSEASAESGAVVAAVSEGTVLVVDTDTQAEEGWVAVGYTGKTRYVSAEYVDVSFATTEAITIAEEQEIARKKAEEEAKRKSSQTTEIIVVQNEAVNAAEDEILLLAAIIQCEAGNECYEGQVAVGAVVMNRVRSSRYPNTISEVIYAPKQFSPVASGLLASVLANGPKESCIQAAQEAVNGVDNTNGAKNFRQTKTGHAGLVIGGHVFF